ncbi:MAG: hypothetical protein GWN81_02375 [Phycisphaerae bacterium]|nr:hypothetical protein [Phycisphaerae bacterium]NIU07716.1 hypothetical protein [Phycisphaerae bacterium]
MKKTLSEWASLAEVISGIAVVVTVVFLIIEIRTSTEVTRASMYANNMNTLIEWRNLLIEDRDTARLWESYTAGRFHEEDTTDQLRMLQLVANNINIYENAFYARQYGVLGSSEWTRFQRMSCVQYNWIIQSPLAESIEMVTTDQFRAFLQENCGEDTAWPEHLPTN